MRQAVERKKGRAWQSRGKPKILKVVRTCTAGPRRRCCFFCAPRANKGPPGGGRCDWGPPSEKHPKHGTTYPSYAASSIWPAAHESRFCSRPGNLGAGEILQLEQCSRKTFARWVRSCANGIEDGRDVFAGWQRRIENVG